MKNLPEKGFVSPVRVMIVIKLERQNGGGGGGGRVTEKNLKVTVQNLKKW